MQLCLLCNNILFNASCMFLFQKIKYIIITNMYLVCEFNFTCFIYSYSLHSESFIILAKFLLVFFGGGDFNLSFSEHFSFRIYLILPSHFPCRCFSRQLPVEILHEFPIFTCYLHFWPILVNSFNY